MNWWSFRRVGAWQFCVIVLFLVLSAIQSGKALHLDDADLPVWAKAVADTGKPIAYRGQDRVHDLFVYHPPLYVYVLGAWIRVFGYGPEEIRMFGALCALVFGALLLEFLAALFGREARNRVSLYFWPFFLLNPYTLQGASIADIDTTIYGPLLWGFLLSLILLLWRDGEPRLKTVRMRQLLIPAGLLFLCFWAKWTSILLFVPAPFFIMLFRYGWKTALRLWVTIFAMGFGLFVITFLAWCSWFGVSYTTHLHWLVAYHAIGLSSNPIISYWLTLTDMVPFTLKWTGVTAWVTAIALLAISVRAAWKDERARHFVVFLAISLGGALLYIMQRHTFGFAPYKYHFVFWGMICLALPLLIASGGRPFNWRVDGAPADGAKPVWRRWYAWSAAGVALAALVGDWFVQDKDIRAIGPQLTHYMPYWFIAPAAAGIALLVLRSRRAVSGILLALMLFCVGLQAGVCIFQAKQPYSTTYEYGQEGIEDAAAYIRLMSQPRDVVFCLKDIGPLTGRRYIDSYDYIYGGPDLTATAIHALGRWVNIAVFTEGIGEDQLDVNKDIKRWINLHCTLMKSIGNYRIYFVSR